MAHLHSIYDSDLHFVIDPDTRVITNQMENKNSVIQFDHNSERFTFELPRYIEEHDMLSCNRVEVHYLNIETKTGDQNIGIYEVQDLQVSPHDDKVVICSWLVSSNATKYAGTLNFVLRFACVTNEVDYIWNTAVFKNFAIQNGLYNSEPVVEQYADVLAEWYQSLFTASADGVTNIQEARAAAITAVDAVADERIADIEQAGSDVLASLPPEYLELVENVAPPIVESASGESIAIHDSADRKLRGLNLYGKSTQDGTPTPEAPVEIESAVEPTVRVCGKNLVKPKVRTETINGVTFTVTNDGTIIANGTATKASFFAVGSDFKLTPDNQYVLSGCPEGGAFDTFMVYLHYNDSGLDVYNRIGETTFTPRDEKCSAVVVVYEGVTANNLIFRPMVRLASFNNSEYEPYTEQTLPVTRTLAGIPVTSDGNYTDENGQQWICDEVDFERGVHVQRVELKTFSLYKSVYEFSPLGYRYQHHAGVNFTLDNICLCRTLPYNSNVGTDQATTDGVRLNNSAGYIIAQYTDVDGTADTIDLDILYILPTPLETALTPEELAAYASLRSNYPNTSVLNDGGAGMAVAYVADTKLYIDKKLAE